MAIETQAVGYWQAYASAARTLLERARGQVILPGAEEYDGARAVWNARVSRYPAAVVRAADVEDVILTVNVAREHGIQLAVRSGGHSLTGFSTVNGGIILDLSGMKAMTIDPKRRVARVQPGLTWAEYAAQATPYGLATTSGDAPGVGVGGLTVGGGIGWMVRKYGLTIDHLISAEVVTADGRLVTASETENADLFWAIRGGGGNFGILTSLELRLDPVGTVLGGAVFYAEEEAESVLNAYAAFTAEAPEELTTIALVMRLPPMPFIPPESQGQLGVGIFACYCGELSVGEEAVAPLRAFGSPVADVIAPMPYVGMLEMLREPTVWGNHHDTRSAFAGALNREMLETSLNYLRAATSPTAMLQIRHLGGAMSRVPADATAFSHRDKEFMVTILNSWMDPEGEDRHIKWTRAFWAAIRPYTSGVYVNFIGDGEDRVHEAYSPATLKRLGEIKRAYDPENFFRLNQNIKP
jgi:FAD/FMN-containing dehydrogenase